MAKVLVTPRSLTRETHPSVERLKEAGHTVIMATPGKMPTKDELLELLPDCTGYLAGVEHITADVLESAPELKVISRNGVGIDTIDLEAAERLGIKIETTPGANSRGVVELTVGLIFSLFRSIPASDAMMKNAEWKRYKGSEIENKTLGIIGCGNIGKLVAVLMGTLGMNVLGYDLHPDHSFKREFFTWETLETVLSESDVITLHCPPMETPIVNSKTISDMKDGVFIVNTARAELVEENAVLEALEHEKITGFASDVLGEGQTVQGELVTHPKVIATPHIGGYTKESVERSAEGAVSNILKHLR